MTPEARVKLEIKNWLKDQGAYFFMPVQTGYGSTTLDFLACLRGRFIGIETKRKGVLNPTPRQRVTMDNITAAGGDAYCVDSLASLLDQMP